MVPTLVESVEHLLETFEEIVERTYDANLEPDPKRGDWSSHRLRLDELLALYEKVLLPALDDVKDELDERIMNALETRAAYLGLGIFAALHASGQSGRALPFLATVRSRAERTDASELFGAVGRDVPSTIELARLRHRLANGFTTARPELKKLAKNAREKAIANEALEMFHAPQPLTSAPSLSTLNGFGTGLYGSRDQDSDGSEIKTLCISALYIPLFPLKAYRVIDHGDGSYSFMSKNRLSTFARSYQKLLAAAVVLLVGYFAVNSYLNSPDRLAGKALAAADQVRDSGDADKAISAYESLVDRWARSASSETVSTAARRATELRLAEVPDPLVASKLESAVTVLRRYRNYPFEARSDANNSFVVDRVLTWSSQLDTDEAMSMNAAIAVLDEGFEVAGARRDDVNERRRAIKTKLATMLAPRRPIDALAILVELDAKSDIEAVLSKLEGNPSLLREAAPSLEAWFAANPSAAARKDQLTAALAQLDDEDRQKALASDDASLLTASLEKYPGDHALVAALAELDRAQGRSNKAIERLTALGEPGWLTGNAQQTLAASYGDDGAIEKADAILSELLRFRLPAFRRAASAYYKAGDDIRNRLISRAETGSAPPAVMMAIQSNDETKAKKAFNDWVATEMAQDLPLAGLKSEFERHVFVVPASITLGTIKLRRANAVAGEAREALLAEAEAAFIAISDDAVGLPSYHLGLGQVYHRLGKTEEGDAELDGLLARNDPPLSLSVSRAYRELGQNKRAIEIGEKVYNDSASPIREAAAHHLSYVVDTLDDKEKWLERSDSSSPAVKISLTEVRARRAAEQGEDAKAAKLFRESAKYYEREAKHSSVAANNAAVAYLEIYSVTGDLKQLPKARKGLEASLRLEPGSALVVSNLASHCEFEGWLDVLGDYAPVGAMRFQRNDLTTIASLVLRGELRSDVLDAARKNKILRRGRDLNAQELVLAPNNALGWERSVTWATLSRDEAALEALAEQLARVVLDTSGRDAAMAKERSGELDAESIEQAKLSIARFEEMVATARKKRSKRGEAMARYLLGSALGHLAWTQRDLELGEKGLEELETAMTLWPALGDTVSRTTLRLAIIRAAATSKPVAAMHETGWRLHSVTTMLATALAGEDGPAIKAAIKADSNLAAAARKLAAGKREPSLTMWLIGRITGNSKLEERGARAFEEKHHAINAMMGQTFSPTSLRAKTLAALYKTSGTL